MSVIEYHSQPATAQDKWVVSQIGYGSPGYFVEVGAHNGVRHSNTLTLEKHFGWTGLLIEANPELFRECLLNRPDSKCVEAAIGPTNAHNQNFAFAHGIGSPFSGLTRHMNREWLQNHEFHNSTIRPVTTHTLLSILKQYNAPPTIDYLSLDVEGAEYAILESFFQPKTFREDRFHIRYMTVEFLYDRLTLAKLERLLEPQYVLDEVRAFDACFIHRNEVHHARTA